MGKSQRREHYKGDVRPRVRGVCGSRVCRWRREGRWALTILPGPRGAGPAPLPPAPRPRLALGVLPQLLLMTCSCLSARSARSRSSSMNCCSRSLALASRAAVSFRNWSICTTSLGPEQSLTPVPRPVCPPTLASRERHGHSCPQCLLMGHMGTHRTGPGTLSHTMAHKEMSAYTPSHTFIPHSLSPKHTNGYPCSSWKYSQAYSVTHSHLLPPDTLTGTHSHTAKYTKSNT